MATFKNLDLHSLRSLAERFNRTEAELRKLIGENDLFFFMTEDGISLDSVGVELLRSAILGERKDPYQELQRMTHYVAKALQDYQKAAGALAANGAVDPEELQFIRSDGELITKLARSVNKFAVALGEPEPFPVETS